MAAPTPQQLDQCERELMTRLRQVYGDKKWILAGEILQGIDGGVLTVRGLGASDAIAIGSRIGVGDLAPDVRRIISDDQRVGDEATMVDRMHDNNRELHDLPQWVIDEVDEWDPDHQAQVIATFTIDAGLIANRPTFGARKLEWGALEDKITIRDVWRAAGIETAPDRVVDLSDVDALLAAHDELAGRWGTVWAVDNEQGWHGGGVGTHWVQSPERARELATELAESYRQVRIQPFLDGVPCSIHGMVLSDATLAFRPCEMVVLLDTAASKFTYSRAATFWDPAPKDRQQMRSVARAIGDELRSRVDFRGVFTVDGVLTADGFRPTEVNPRFGAALPPRLPTADGETLPVFFTHLAAGTGNLDDFDPALLEALLLDRLDNNRAGGCFIFTDKVPAEERKLSIAGTWNGSAFLDLREASDDEEPIAHADWGPNAGKGFIFTNFTDQMPVGPPVAPTVVALRKFFSDHWDLDLAALRPAFDT